MLPPPSPRRALHTLQSGSADGGWDARLFLEPLQGPSSGNWSANELGEESQSPRTSPFNTNSSGCHLNVDFKERTGQPGTKVGVFNEDGFAAKASLPFSLLWFPVIWPHFSFTRITSPHPRPRHQRGREDSTSSSFSLWIRGVKWSLSTSHANGGCQSWGQGKGFCYENLWLWHFKNRFQLNPGLRVSMDTSRFFPWLSNRIQYKQAPTPVRKLLQPHSMVQIPHVPVAGEWTWSPQPGLLRMGLPLALQTDTRYLLAQQWFLKRNKKYSCLHKTVLLVLNKCYWASKNSN